MAKNIVLTGMPGSGKSSVSMILAKKFENKRILVDTDEKIAEKFGISIPEIFEQFGEKEFRKSEFEIISHLSDKNSLIISVGGGCLCNEQNIEQMRKNGIIFYLKTSVEELLRRTGNDAQSCYENNDLNLHHRDPSSQTKNP